MIPRGSAVGRLRRRTRAPGVVALLTVGVGLGQALPAAGQEPPAATADTVRLTPAEELRARQRERLARLSRAPGQDTLEAALADTLPALSVGPAARGARSFGGLDPAGDTIVEGLLRELAGYEPVQYEAEGARFQAGTRDLYLRGDSANRVTVRYQDQQVSADSIHFNQVTDLVEARGQPVYTPREGNPVASQRLLVDTRTQEASAFGAETEYTEGATWRMIGDLPRVRSDLVFASHARFTSCDLEVPHYHFAADRVKIVRGNILVARPVRLYFGDVPVLWLPFIAQSLATGRASGLLTPRFSVNDVVRQSGGYQRRLSNLGFYWAASDFADATVALDWFSGNFTALTGGVRYRHLDRFLNGSINASHFWREGGRRELSLNGQHSWEMSERTRMNASVAYVSSAEFLRRHTFDPVEATQEIRSSGGFTHRFDWGQLNVSANRSQSLSSDRVDLTFPRAQVTLRPITLFAAPPTRAAWFNNMTWNGGGDVSRRTLGYPAQAPDAPFTLRLADQGTLAASARHGLSMGNFSIDQGVRFQEGTVRGVPLDSLPWFPAFLGPEDALRFVSPAFDEDPTLPSQRVDVSQSTIDWNTSFSYQQRLVGTTTLTPSISFSGKALRSDTVDVAQSFVSEPTRVSFGASLRSDMYGFFPGFGPFEAVRHKVSPGFSYSWAPEVEPTDLQRRVFGSRALQPTRLLSVSVAQTFEAKRRPSATQPAPGAPPEAREADVEDPEADPAEAADPEDVEGAGPPPGFPDEDPDGPTRRVQGEIVNLLALRTSAINYDFVQADSAGHFLHGFTTTRLRNEVASDYLRGLTLSVEHDLFQDSDVPVGDGTTTVRRRVLAPHLSAVNLSFSLNARSGIFQRLGLASGRDVGPDTAAPDDTFEEGDFDDTADMMGEASILRARGRGRLDDGRDPSGRRGEWNAALSYALTRPRGGDFGFGETMQSLQVSMSANPTENWRMSWRTSYDMQNHRFNDHIVRLARDLHRWQANFDFLQTATGNWAFRFEVSLTDNRDLMFDYQQRSVDTLGRPGAR